VSRAPSDRRRAKLARKLGGGLLLVAIATGMIYERVGTRTSRGARRSSCSDMQIIIHESGHRVHEEAPGAVIDAVRELLTEIRSATSPPAT
jgi:pimeloyl-ACP methyl ester carboxylesterase